MTFIFDIDSFDMTFPTLRRSHLRLLAAGLTVLLFGCNSSTNDDSSARSGSFATTSIVFGDNGDTTSYLSLLPSLAVQEIDYDTAQEFLGWADLGAQGNKLFVSDGDAPALTRFSIAANGSFQQDERISFANYGAETAAFWRNVIVSATKAYLFVLESREVVVWNPTTMKILDTFALPALPDRDDRKAYITTDRGSVLRGDRLYVTVGWGNWDDYSLSNDSAILVIDTSRNEVVDTLPVACPDLNVATLDDAGNVYFSNWVYGVSPVLWENGSHTCAVRIKSGQDAVDADWSLTFADVTDGREAAALRFIGDGKALISVFYADRVELGDGVERAAVVDSANWRSWTLDLETLETAEVADIDWHSGGFYTTRIEDHTMLFLPSADYSSTTASELLPDGTLEERWQALGWATRLFALR